MSTSANQNEGTASITDESAVIPRSTMPRGRIAPITPSTTPRPIPITSETSPSDSVTGARSRIMSITGSFEVYEFPKSPCTASPSHAA